MHSYKIGRDTNGNKTVRVIPSTGRGFSIQTNGNLPITHRDGIHRDTGAEVELYVRKHGTARQKAIMDIPATPAPYQPKTGAACSCRPGVQRDNCPACEGTGQCIDFAAIRARHA